MTYPPDDAERLRKLSHAFRPFIETNRYFDILHSDKSGYIYLTADDAGRYYAQLIETAAQLLDILVRETVAAVKREADAIDPYAAVIDSAKEHGEILSRLDAALEAIDGDLGWYRDQADSTLSGYLRLW